MKSTAQPVLGDARNPTQTLDNGVIYGVEVLVPVEEPTSTSTAAVFSQSMLDAQLRDNNVGLLNDLKTTLTTGQTVMRKVLTYFSENTFSQQDITIDDRDKDSNGNDAPDGALDPAESDGKWVGIGRLYMTPLTLGYNTLQDNGTSTFDTSKPFIVRVVSVTFSVNVTTVDVSNEVTGTEAVKYIGPVRKGMRGVPCTIAYIAPDKISDAEQIQDAGDAYVISKTGEVPDQSSNKTYTTYFCGVGLTTRTRTGYEANKNQPLYEAGMQDASGTWAPESSVVVAVPEATHKLVLVKSQAPTSVNTAAKNNYAVQPLTDTEKTFTGAKVLEFQTSQFAGKGATVNKPIPLWGAVQIQVPRNAIRGMILDAVVAEGGSLKDVTTAIVNTNLVLSVEVGAKASGQ